MKPPTTEPQRDTHLLDTSLMDNLLALGTEKVQQLTEMFDQ